MVTQNLPLKLTIFFQNQDQLPKSNIAEIDECDNELSDKELYIFLMIMQNNTLPGNDGLTKELFCNFLGRYKICLF